MDDKQFFDLDAHGKSIADLFRDQEQMDKERHDELDHDVADIINKIRFTTEAYAEIDPVELKKLVEEALEPEFDDIQTNHRLVAYGARLESIASLGTLILRRELLRESETFARMMQILQATVDEHKESKNAEVLEILDILVVIGRYMMKKAINISDTDDLFEPIYIQNITDLSTPKQKEEETDNDGQQSVPQKET